MPHVLHVVSDATGETGERMLGSALVQFPHVQAEVQRFGGVRTAADVHEAVRRAREHGAMILHTLVSHELRRLMLAECRNHDVDAMDLMGPVLDRLAAVFHTRPQEQPGLIEQLRDARTRVIEAVDFAFRHDDGQHTADYGQAEIVLLGVSRTMKTPLCLYLANRGWFAANVPVVQSLALPGILDEIPARRVFGLTMRPARLLELRSARAKYLQMAGGGYADLPSIRAELHEAELLFRGRGWKTIDVTGKSIEEIARQLIDLRRLDPD